MSINLAILGSTGSIGRQALSVVRRFPGRWQVVALAAGSNLGLLSLQVEEFKPRFIYHQGSPRAVDSKRFIPLSEMASHPEVDMVLLALSGMAGLRPALNAARAGKVIALANKESLVMAGSLLQDACQESGSSLRPVDSEHSAIWQCLEDGNPPRKVILTASGGPFRGYSREELSQVTPEQALRHPSWKMGKKVTIDSATLMNKGLEVIEAHFLFNLPYDNISVLVHPETVVHALVEFADGSVKAQLAYPDMRLPIQFALSYPERLENEDLPRLGSCLEALHFLEPDRHTFPCLDLAVTAAKNGATYPAVLCGADEGAVELFLERKISFTDIPRLIQDTLERHEPYATTSVEEIEAAGLWAYSTVKELASS